MFVGKSPEAPIWLLPSAMSFPRLPVMFSALRWIGRNSNPRHAIALGIGMPAPGIVFGAVSQISLPVNPIIDALFGLFL